MVESVIERVAFELKMSPDDVRAKNFYKVGMVSTRRMRPPCTNRVVQAKLHHTCSPLSGARSQLSGRSSKHRATTASARQRSLRSTRYALPLRCESHPLRVVCGQANRWRKRGLRMTPVKVNTACAWRSDRGH